MREDVSRDRLCDQHLCIFREIFVFSCKNLSIETQGDYVDKPRISG